MQNFYLINRGITVKRLQDLANSEVKYYTTKKGNLKGIKKLQDNSRIFLLEFSDHKRIWFTKDELEIPFKKN